MKILQFFVRKWFQRVCACGHSPVAHEHYTNHSDCAVCHCPAWRPRGWRLK